MTTSAPVKKVKKACKDCRQQKAKCDAYLNPEQPCSRCARLHIPCQIIDNFEREHKRRKLYQLQNETDQLRNQLRFSTGTISSSPPAPTKSFSPETGVLRQTGPSTAVPHVQEHHMAHDDSPTRPWALGDVAVEAPVLDDVFALWTTQYHQFLPILQENLTPNMCHDKSPLLFWSIVMVVSKSRPQLLDLRRKIYPMVTDMALATLKAPPSVLNVQALTIHANWVMSRSPRNDELGHAINGALISMAVQLGLHVPVSSQDFSKCKLTLTETDLKRRAELWAYCLLSYQRTCICKGNPSTCLADLTLDPDQRDQLWLTIDPELKQVLRIQDITVRCCEALAKNGLVRMNEERERAIESLLWVFGTELEEVRVKPGLVKMSYSLARVYIESFRFFKSPASQRSVRLKIVSLCIHACEYLESLHDHVNTGKWMPGTIPYYFLSGLLMASTVLLRLLKVPAFAQLISRQRAYDALMATTALTRKLHVEPNDHPERLTKFIEELWASKSAFRDPNWTGTEDENPGVPLRVRSRLAMSPAFDAAVWWREVANNNAGVYAPPLKKGADKKQSADRVEGATASGAAEGFRDGYPDQVVLQAQAQKSWQNPPLFDPFATLPSYDASGNDMLPDLWSFWPDVEWGVPGLS